jgi:hypothetical protein
MFLTLNGIFEPSAIQQLPDGRFLIVEDEKSQPFSLLTIHPDGTTSSTPLLVDPANSEAMTLDDLEGISVDAAGYVYAITSHSRTGKGKEKKARERLVRFRVAGNVAVGPVVVSDLKAAMTAAHPVLADAAMVLDVTAAGGINIEALEVTPDGERLLIGFRSPLLERRAIVAGIDNARTMFEAGAAAQMTLPLLTLDLGGDGLRAMSYVPALSAYLVVSGPAAREEGQFRLWSWRGTPQDQPRRISVSGLPGMARAEGVTAAIIDGKPKVVLVSDDGNREQGREARFVVLDPAQLRTEP